MLILRNLFFITMLAVAFAVAGDSQRHQVVNGVSLYLGVIPAQMIRGSERKMHGGDEGRESYHVLVALFDAESGKRITDAKVTANVASVGMRGQEKSLQPMHGDLLSYGNYFTLDRPGRYDIKVEIWLKDHKSPVKAEFFYMRPEE